MADTLRIILRDVKQYDTHQTREFDLSAGSSFPIGRASKNSTKKDLMPAPHNAYIDSPVISRDHAVLSLKPSAGTPQVYITDAGSMHGTLVNGLKLAPNVPKLLSNGDLLQFGVDVNRNEEYFVARKYTFESQPTRPFSHGFSVPDADSEEEDDELELFERQGSQLNPVTIDDSDSASDSSTDDPEEVIEIVEEITIQEEDVPLSPFQTAFDGYQQAEVQDTPAQDVTVVPAHAPSITNPEAARRTTLEQDAESDDAEGSCYDYSSICDEDDAHMRDFDSEAASAGSELGSDIGSELGDIFEREVPDSESEDEDKEEEDEQLKAAYSDTRGPVDAPVAQTTLVSPPVVPIREFYTLDDTACSQHGFGLPPLGVFHHPAFQTESLDEELAPPLPPRLSAGNSQSVKFPNSVKQQTDSPAWYPGEMYTPSSFIAPSMFCFPSAPLQPLQSPQETLSEASQSQAAADMFAPSHDMFRSANRLQTPPSMCTSDALSSPPVQPTRRTKVSIEEIVEEQPPTPTSVNSMKRKADVLEEEEVTITANLGTTPDATGDATTQTTADTATIVAQRPKKQPKSLLRKFANAATYPLLGAAGAVTSFLVLSSLPDDFFL
ncbi:hypothetical protein IQ07DRAFT_591363 [Pyrenochaeta sp. DS3sAY3a]|nr:hypothetical protein IQ07DRAFT_591363 [Pyrenochaeta sp. DS3sAY3a]